MEVYVIVIEFYYKLLLCFYMNCCGILFFRLICSLNMLVMYKLLYRIKMWNVRIFEIENEIEKKRLDDYRI